MTHQQASEGCEVCGDRRAKYKSRQPSCSRCLQVERSLGKRVSFNPRISRQSKKQSTETVSAAYGTAVVYENISLFEDSSAEGHPSSQSTGQTTIKVCSRDDVETLTLGQQHGLDYQAIVAAPSVQIGSGQAVCFFRMQFSWVTVEHFTSPSWTSRSPALLRTSTALGLAMLSFTRRSRWLEREAYAEYGAALKLVNRLLLSPATAALDSTLAAIILMSFFEVLISRSPVATKSWTNHASGAARILTIRGPNQLNSLSGYLLFLETRGKVLAASLIYKMPMPQTLIDYTRIAMAREPQSMVLAGQSLVILAELANIRAAIESGTLSDALEIRRMIHKIESQLNNWKATLPSKWEYEKVTLVDANATVETHCGKVPPYQGCYFLYDKIDPLVPFGWFNYFISQILVGEVLLNSVLWEIPEDPRGRPTLSRTKCWAIRKRMNEMAGAICSSIPWLLELGPSAKNEMLGLRAGYMIMLPLWFAACVEGPGHPLRQHAVLLFDIIAQRMGISYATIYTKELANMKGMADWLDQPRPEFAGDEVASLSAAKLFR